MTLASTETLLLLSIGVSAYLGIFHLGVPSPGSAHRWLAAWALAALAYSLARLVQIQSMGGANFVPAVRVATAAAPVLIWTLLRFLMELAHRPPSRRLGIALASGTFATSLLSLATPWFVTDRVNLRLDMFGVPYPGAQGGPAMSVIGLLVAAGLVWDWRLVGAAAISRRERFTLRSALAIYAGLGGTTVLATLNLMPYGVTELGPFAIAIAASHLVAGRQNALEAELAAQVERQSAALRESAGRYRELVDNAPVTVLVCDRNGELVSANRRMFEMVGSPHRTLQRSVNLLSSDIVRGSGLPELLASAFAQKRTVRGEGRYESAYGVSVEICSTVAPHLDERGDVAGALILVEDVTERNAARTRLRQAQKMEAVGQLAAGIAHEINDPMAYVRSNLAVLREECEALRKQLAGASLGAGVGERFAEMEQLLDESAEGVERTIAIIRDMHELSSGGSLPREPVDLNRVLESVLRMAAASRNAGRCQLVEHYGALPPVSANVGQIRQVFLNLIMNALQAVPDHGRIEVETFADGGFACVRVRDDGEGIPGEHRDRLFEPFFTTKAAGEGTGLGLYLSYRIVQSHGGEIRVESQPGHGASFDVRLPLASAEQPA